MFQQLLRSRLVRLTCARSALTSLIFFAAARCTPATPAAQEPPGAAPVSAASTTAAPVSAAPTPAASTPFPISGAGGTGGIASAPTGDVPAAAGGSGVAGGPSATGAADDAHATICGGIAGRRCAAHQYCAYAADARCGAGDMSGTCTTLPDVCMHLVDPVCGCDGKTYGNSCHAAHAGVSVASKGACQTRDTTAEGGLCGTRGAHDCAEGLYCAYKPDCGATDAGGVCRKKPLICTKIYRPVCGCHGKTYGSACTAAAEGISVVHEGLCAK